MLTYQVFKTNQSNSGNPAAVIETSEENEAKLQAIAAKLNYPVTVFLLPPLEKNGLSRIRFFYPQRETNICVHGALAAACHLLKRNNKGSSIAVINHEGRELLLSQEQEQYFITLSIVETDDIVFNTEAVLEMLNIDSYALDLSLPFNVASCGSPKLLVPIKDLSVLQNLHPKFDQITQWSQETKINGLYVYTAETINKESDFHARNFNPQTGINEDIATGIAAAALIAAVAKEKSFKNYCIEQGFVLKNPCLIYGRKIDRLIKIGGLVLMQTH